MKTILGLVISCLLLAGAWAQEPVRELEPKAAVKLIALINEISEKPIAITAIVSGSKNDDGFEASHVRRVISIHPVAEDGSRVRRVRCYDFYWNETYGWFAYEKRVGRGGDEIWIWSENQKDIVIK